MLRRQKGFPLSQPVVLLLALLALIASTGGQSGAKETSCDPGAYSDQRERMVRDQIQERGVTDERVLNAMRKVGRHCFVPSAIVREAYADHPLPIGLGQTISQPYIVARMTELLELKPSDRVLEIGTGSGYQTAILAKLVRQVYSIEIHALLADKARSRLGVLGIKNVEIKEGDGYYGWQAYAPFDAIMVTAGADKIPPPLLRQLKPGGRMCIPVGGTDQVQQLTLIKKDAKGVIATREVLPVRFVPLLGRHD